MENYNFNRKNNGITLIALVVSIIVLLILAGISISMLSGENGILNRATEAKRTYQISSEKEAISLIVASAQIDTSLGNNVNYIGKKLYTKNFVNSDKWDYIYTTNDNKSYGDGWYYITKDVNLDNYGKAQNEWLVNYDTNEIIELASDEYVEFSISNDVLITDGLIFNIDSNDISVSDKSTWGNGVELYGFDNDENQDNANGLYFDGVDDYVSFKSNNTFDEGFTVSFYGIFDEGKILVKQSDDDVAYSCRFGFEDNHFIFNTSKKSANSNWSQDSSINNGNLVSPSIFKNNEICYLDLTFTPSENKFIIYKDGIYVDETVVSTDYWNGTGGGKKILEDSDINFYIGKWFGGAGGIWNYTKGTIYNLKLYNRFLSPEEIKENYTKTTAYHNN